MTELTHGIITNIAYSGTTASGRVFTDQIIISKRNCIDPRLSDSGDSGSVWVIESEVKVVALHWGGSSTGNEAYASPICNVESELNIKISTE